MIPLLGVLLVGGAFVIGQLLQLVGDFAVNDVPPWVRRAHLVALAALVGQPGLVPLVALSGNHLATLAAAFIPLLVAVGLWAFAVIPQGHQGPLAAGTAAVGAAEAWDRTRKAINKLFLGLGLYLLVDLIYGIWFAALPFGEDRTLIPWAVATWVVVLFGVAVLGKVARKIGRGLLLAAFIAAILALIVGFPVVLANGGWGDTKTDVTEVFRSDGKAAAPAPSARGLVLTEKRQYVTLLGPGKLAGPVDLDALEAGWRLCWSPFPGSIVWDDGARSPGNRASDHVPVGLVWFTGLAGKQVSVYKSRDCKGGDAY